MTQHYAVAKRAIFSRSASAQKSIWPGHSIKRPSAPMVAWANVSGLESTSNTPRKTVREYVTSECVGVGGKVGEGHRMVRSKDWKYVLTDSNEEALFDETKDPYEMRNVIGDPANANTVRQHRNQMHEWMRATGDTHAQPPAA